MSAKHGMTGGGYGSGLWPVLLALLVVLIPTACVLWFLNQAVHNERLAAKQRVVEAYRGYLPLLRNRLETYWQQQAAALEAAAGKSPAPAAFAACLRGVGRERGLLRCRGPCCLSGAGGRAEGPAG